MPRMRLDRLLTLGLVNPLRRASAGGFRLPILMYHSISDTEETVSAYYRTATSPKKFCPGTDGVVAKPRAGKR